MSAPKLGSMCIVIGGSPNVRGLIVQVVERLGAAFGGEDVCRVRATAGPHHDDGTPMEAIIDRHKLQPAVGPVDLVIVEPARSQFELLCEQLAESEARSSPNSPFVRSIKRRIKMCGRTDARRTGLSYYDQNPIA